MKNEAKDILMKILDIIDYRGDREEFSLKFLDLIYRGAIVKAIENLTPDKRLELDSEMKGKNHDESMNVLLKYIGKSDYEKAVEKSALEMFIDYVQKITPTLDKDRKTALKEYLGSLAKRS